MKVQTSLGAFLCKYAWALICRKPRPRRTSLMLAPDAIVDQTQREFVVPLSDTVTVTVLPGRFWSVIEAGALAEDTPAGAAAWLLRRD